MIEYREFPLTQELMERLIAFSEDWAAEKSCTGYRANTPEDIEGNRVFLATEGEKVIAYLFGRAFLSKDSRSIMPDDTPCFEVEELYVVPERRSQGVGRALFEQASQIVSAEAQYILLSTATRNWRAILHFYIDELGMTFWNARLYKELRSDSRKAID